MEKYYDVIIVGAGLAGSALACLLTKQAKRVCLIERHVPDFTHNTVMSRPLSLSLSSQIILSSLGLWDALSGMETPIKAVHVSVKGRFGRSVMSDNTRAHIGYVLPFYAVHRMLYESIDTRYLTVLQSDALLDIQEVSDHVSVRITHDNKAHTVNAAMLLGADGAHSPVRKALSLPVDMTTADQCAITGLLSLSKPHKGVGYERFHAPGILALLPTKDPLVCGVVWSLPRDQAKKILTLSPEEQCQKIQDAFGYRLGACLAFECRGEFPLLTALSPVAHKGRALLVGNAAHTIHPIAAQGFNLTLRDIDVLVDIFSDKAAWDNVPASLQRYCSQRAADQDAVIQFVKTVGCIFSERACSGKSAKGLGLFLLDCMPGLKAQLLGKAQGMNGPLSDRLRQYLYV